MKLFILQIFPVWKFYLHDGLRFWSDWQGLTLHEVDVKFMFCYYIIGIL